VCGRYTNTQGPEEIGRHFGLSIPDAAGTHRYNIAPTEEVLAIVAPKGEREARLLRWGLVPSYATDLKSSAKMINARIETVTTNSAYRRLIPRAERRALQVADGYYEWLKPEKRGEPRQPFHFQVDGGVPFAFAALWTPARLSSGDWVHSVALLTCDPGSNEVARAIHNRMPVILADADAQRAWLDPAFGAEDALALCGPLPSERLSVGAANPAVNRADPDNDGPELLLPPS
jgi:putative SOS response-associated peptidase YedK